RSSTGFLSRQGGIKENLFDPLRHQAVGGLHTAQSQTLCVCQGSNLGPFEYQSNALPTELHTHIQGKRTAHYSKRGLQTKDPTLSSAGPFPLRSPLLAGRRKKRKES